MVEQSFGDKQSFEDFPAGRIVESAGYMVTRDEIIAFARQYDPQERHLEAEGDAAQGACASNWHVSAIAMRLMFDSYLVDTDSMGSPGLDKISWLRPVRDGDVLALRSTCLEARRSRSRPEMGICRFLWELLDAAGAPVCTIAGTQLIKVRHPEEPA